MALVAGTQQNLSNLYSLDMYEITPVAIFTVTYKLICSIGDMHNL